MPEAREQVPLPPGLDLLWGRRERGKRGPRAGLSADAIVAAAIRIADAEGLEAVSMARVANELGFTTMSLYRHVASKDELLQLMWNASALGAEHLVHRGRRLAGQAADVGHHPAGHARPASVDHPDADGRPPGRAELAASSSSAVSRRSTGPASRTPTSCGCIGLLSSYTLSEARMASDAARAPQQAQAAARRTAMARQVRRPSRPCCGNSSTSRPTRACTASPGPRCGPAVSERDGVPVRHRPHPGRRPASSTAHPRGRVRLSAWRGRGREAARSRRRGARSPG